MQKYVKFCFENSFQAKLSTKSDNKHKKEPNPCYASGFNCIENQFTIDRVF